MLKSQMIKMLKEKGITNVDGKKLSLLKTAEIARVFDTHFDKRSYRRLAKSFFA